MKRRVKKGWDGKPKYNGMNNTIVRGGQIGSISWKVEEKVKLFEWFCLRHPVYDIERSNPNYNAMKIMPIKMGQTIVEEDTKEGRKIEYFSQCPKCRQVIKEGEYIKDA